MSLKPETNIKKLLPADKDPNIAARAAQAGVDPCKPINISDMSAADMAAKVAELTPGNLSLGPGLDAATLIKAANGGDQDSITKGLSNAQTTNLNKSMNQAAKDLKNPKEAGENIIGEAIKGVKDGLKGVIDSKIKEFDNTRKKIPTKTSAAADLTKDLGKQDLAIDQQVKDSLAKVPCNGKAANDAGGVKRSINKSIDSKLAKLSPKEIKEINKTDASMEKFKNGLQSEVQGNLSADQLTKAANENLKPLKKASRLGNIGK